MWNGYAQLAAMAHFREDEAERNLWGTGSPRLQAGGGADPLQETVLRARGEQDQGAATRPVRRPDLDRDHAGEPVAPRLRDVRQPRRQFGGSAWTAPGRTGRRTGRFGRNFSRSPSACLRHENASFRSVHAGPSASAFKRIWRDGPFRCCPCGPFRGSRSSAVSRTSCTWECLSIAHVKALDRKYGIACQFFIRRMH